MSRPRKSSISIHDYPEDLNPFNDDTSTLQSSVSVELRPSKEPKNKFWTFGRSKKKRSNSFSVKSAWSGLFGSKHKEPTEAERRTTITTVSSSYQNGQFSRPIPPPRLLSKDQQEFEEIFGTFTRRKKYTMESSSTYGSNLTVNGDPARLYNGSPQDTTASILGDHTPKPPARRFGQVSPRSKDGIPPLEFQPKDENQTSPSDTNDRVSEEVPVPTRRVGRKAVPRVSVLEVPEEEGREIGGDDVTLRDENENLSDDFIFRRCSQDAVRRSNLSINSCISTASCISSSGRKKRRAPQPPQRKESAENLEESSAQSASPIELQITEAIDIAKVTEDIQEMTKQSQNIDETISSNTVSKEEGDEVAKSKVDTSKKEEAIPKTETEDSEGEKLEAKSSEKLVETAEENLESKDEVAKEKNDNNQNMECIEVDKIEINRVIEDKIEIITDINANSEKSDDEVEIRKKSGKISRSDSFSVKEQIEQIERQIKELEAKNVANNNGNNNNNNNNVTSLEENKLYEPSELRLSIQANRRSFFKNMVGNDPNGVKIEIKELPREQKQIQVVKLTDPPVPIDAPKEPVKVVELHISEPIKQVPELVDGININPLPKPRRHSSTPAQSSLNGSRGNVDNDFNDKTRNTRGDSL